LPLISGYVVTTGSSSICVGSDDLK